MFSLFSHKACMLCSQVRVTIVMLHDVFPSILPFILRLADTPRSERRLEAALQMTKNTLYADQFDRLPLHRAKTERRDEYRAYKQQKERVLEVIYFIRGGSDAQIERARGLLNDPLAARAAGNV